MDSQDISNAQYFFWIGLKNSFLWGFPVEDTRVEDNGTLKYWVGVQRGQS